MIRQLLKRSVNLIRTSRRIPDLLRRHRIITTYLASNEIRKLQLGSGPTSLDGWLASDINPNLGHLYLDATRPFPFDNGMFDYIYSEHMIEHISWHEGLFMLRECRRILKLDGTIRIATPDLRVLMGLYRSGPLNDGYIKWVTDTFLNELKVYKASFVINNSFRNWGHQFLYDGELLEMALREAGFVNIRQCCCGESDDENLRGIESHGKNIGTDQMAAFETMVFEGN